MEIDRKYAITPYLTKLAEYQLSCALILNSTLGKTRDFGFVSCSVCLSFSPAGCDSYIGSIKTEDLLRDPNLRAFKTKVEDSLKESIKHIPSPPFEFPKSFSMDFGFSPIYSVQPISCSIEGQLGIYVSALRREIGRFEGTFEELFPVEPPEGYGIYQMSLDIQARSASCDIRKSTGDIQFDERLKSLFLKHSFPEEWFRSDQNLEHIPEKFQVSILYVENNISAFVIGTGLVIRLVPELENQIPLPLPRPPENLSQYETSLLKLRRHCEDNPSDQETCLRYAALIVQYAQKAKVNPTAQFPWEDAAKTSIEICRTTLERFPDSAQAHFQLGYCLGLYAELFHTVPFHIEEINREYKIARSLDQTGIWLGNRHLVNLYKSIGRCEEAIAELETDPRRDDDVLYTLATLKHKIGDYHGALENVKELETLIEQEEFYFSQQNALNELKATIEKELKK